jgi:two-component system response regulator
MRAGTLCVQDLLLHAHLRFYLAEKQIMHKSRTVLLVENNPDDADLAQLAFEKQGIRHSLVVVSDGREAMNYLMGKGQYAERQRFPMPELVLLDLGMPGVSGFEILKMMRREAQLKDLPVTVFSGSDYLNDVNRAYLFGANSFLAKPIEFVKFAAAIKEAVEFWVDRESLGRTPVYLQMPEQPCSASPVQGE